LREQNVLRLEWAKVDLQRRVMWVRAGAAKAKKPIGIPLNRDAIDVLKAQQGRHGRWVFPAPPHRDKKGNLKPIAPFDRANNHGFKAAQVRAGIAPLSWHDLRHTWASWHVMQGTSLRALMELGGWRSIQSVLRYAHLSPEHLASDAARVEGLARNLHG
jgi:integrase